MRVPTITCCLLLLLGMPAIGQETSESTEVEQKEKIVKERMIERLRRAAKLPGTAEQAREAGVPEEEVKEVLEKGKTSKVPASDMQEVLEQETRSAREHGPIDNFGTFVQQKLDEGLRGRELADAIHREHAARGKGKYRDKAHKPGKGKGKGKDKAAKKAKGEREHDDDDDDHEYRDRRYDDAEEAEKIEGRKRVRVGDDREDDSKGETEEASEAARKRRDAAREKLGKGAEKAKRQKPEGARLMKKEDE